jgi:hypothetical protein
MKNLWIVLSAHVTIKGQNMPRFSLLCDLLICHSVLETIQSDALKIFEKCGIKAYSQALRLLCYRVKWSGLDPENAEISRCELISIESWLAVLARIFESLAALARRPHSRLQAPHPQHPPSSPWPSGELPRHPSSWHSTGAHCASFGDIQDDLRSVLCI